MFQAGPSISTTSAVATQDIKSLFAEDLTLKWGGDLPKGKGVDSVRLVDLTRLVHPWSLRGGRCSLWSRELPTFTTQRLPSHGLESHPRVHGGLLVPTHSLLPTALRLGQLGFRSSQQEPEITSCPVEHQEKVK